MRVAYLAGPYRAPTENALWENIMEARRIAVELWKLGYAVICPHTNTAFFGLGADHDHIFLDGDLEIISRLDPKCDCMVMMPKWRDSVGACGEREVAMKCGLTSYEWPHVPPAVNVVVVGSEPPEQPEGAGA